MSVCGTKCHVCGGRGVGPQIIMGDGEGGGQVPKIPFNVGVACVFNMAQKIRDCGALSSLPILQ